MTCALCTDLGKVLYQNGPRQVFTILDALVLFKNLQIFLALNDKLGWLNKCFCLIFVNHFYSQVENS